MLFFTVQGADFAGEERWEHFDLFPAGGQQVRPGRAQESVVGGGTEPSPAVGRALHWNVGQN